MTTKPYGKVNRKIFEELSDSEKEWVRNLQYHEKMGRIDPVYFAEKHLGLTLHQGQKDYLRFSDPIYIKHHPQEVAEWNATHKTKIRSGHKNILNPANRWGKGLYIDEPILGEDGFKPIKDFKVGDKVATVDGTFVPIIGFYPQGERDTYKFIFDDNSSLIVDDQHLWTCLMPKGRFYGGDWETLSTTDIISKLGYNHSPINSLVIPSCEPIQFKARKVLIDPYVLGLLLGDGGLAHGCIFTTADTELLSALPYKYKKIGKYDYRLYGVTKLLRAYGLFGKKSADKFIPRDYLYNSVSTRFAVLQGLLDTDGSIESKNGKIEFSSVSKQLADDVVWLVRSLGGKVKISDRVTSFTYRGVKKNGQKSYRLRIKIEMCPFRLSRKVKKYRRCHYTYNRILKKIEPLGKKPTICIAVDHPSKLFVAKDFIVTHNTVVIAVKHIRYAYYKIPIEEVPSVWESMRYQTLDISPHSTQVDACFNYILDILHSRFPIYPYGKDGQPDPTQRKVNNKCRIDFYTSHNSQKRQITYKTNSYFYGASTGEDQGASLAGKPFGYISYDECVQSHHLREELFGRIFSRTMDLNAPVDLVSTADDQAKSQQYFYHLVRNADKGENDWWIMHGKLDDNVFIPKEILEEAKHKLLKEDPLRYRQVVLGEFIPSSTKVFDIDTIENIWDKNIPEPFRKDLPNPAIENHEYVGSVDWGFSDTGDPTIFTFFDITTVPNQLVYHLVIQGGNPTACLGTLQSLWYHFNKAKIIMDTNAMGGIIIKKMIKDMSREMFNDIYDFTSHGGEKEDAIFRLKLLLSKDRKPAIENGKIVEKNPNYGGLRSYYISELEDQLASYEIEDKKLAQDFVVCLYQFAWYMAKRNRTKGTTTYIITRNNIKQYDPNKL